MNHLLLTDMYDNSLYDGKIMGKNTGEHKAGLPSQSVMSLGLNSLAKAQEEELNKNCH